MNLLERVTPRERNTLEMLRNISGIRVDVIDKVLLATELYSLMQYSENEWVTIPHFGEFKIFYKGDKVSSDGREADVESLYEPSKSMKYNIGVLEDVKKYGGDITKVPCIQDIMKSISTELECVLNETELNASKKDFEE